MAKRRRRKRPTTAELAAAGKRLAAAERKRKALKAHKREKTDAEKKRSAEYLSDELVDRKDGKGKARKFKEGNPGRPVGSENVLPTNVRASVKSIIEKVVRKEEASIEKAIVSAIKSESAEAMKAVKLCAEYTDGKAPQTLTLNQQWNQDELAEAHGRLAAKFNTLFGRLDAQLASEESDAAALETPAAAPVPEAPADGRK